MGLQKPDGPFMEAKNLLLFKNPWVKIKKEAGGFRERSPICLVRIFRIER